MPTCRLLESDILPKLILFACLALNFSSTYASDPLAENHLASEKMSEKVSVSASISKVEGQANLLDVTVTFQIQPEWHIYAQLPKDHPSVLTTIKFATPSTLTTAGKLIAPKAVPSASEPGVFYYQGKSIFRQRFQIESGRDLTDDSAIEVQVRYQACTKTQCLPPASKKIKLEIPR